MKLLLMIVSLSSFNYAQFLGPAQLTIKRLEKCGDDRLGVKTNIMMQKINRTNMGIDFDLKLPFPLDKNTVMNVSIFKWGDGGWKSNIYSDTKKNTCEYMMKFAKEKIMELFKLMNQPESCPLAAGNYSVRKYVFDGVVKVPIIYGEFKAEFMMIKDNVQTNCLRMYVNSAPKKLFG